MTRKSTPRAFKHCKNSLKSLVSDLGSIVKDTQGLHVLKSLLRRPQPPELPVLALGVSPCGYLQSTSLHSQRFCRRAFHQTLGIPYLIAHSKPSTKSLSFVLKLCPPYG